MGFNKCSLPDIESLKDLYSKLGLENFLKQFTKYDAITGSTESFKFLDEKKEEYKKQKLNEF